MKNNMITVTNPWSGYQHDITRKEVIARIHYRHTDRDAWSILHSADYRREARAGYSPKDGTISAYMHS